MRILVDCDGVLSNFVEALSIALEPRMGRRFAPEEVTQWNIAAALGIPRDWVEAAMMGPWFVRNMKPMVGAQEAMQQIHKAGHELVCVTTPGPGWGWINERENWLHQHFREEIGDRIIHTKHKHMVKGDVFIDDKPENVDAWMNEHCDYGKGHGILFDAPYNMHASCRPCRAIGWYGVLSRLRVIGALS